MPQIEPEEEDSSLQALLMSSEDLSASRSCSYFRTVQCREQGGLLQCVLSCILLTGMSAAGVNYAWIFDFFLCCVPVLRL